MRFGEKLRALRREKGLTQAELAKLAGVGLKTITNYEKGTTYPQNREVYGILARILGCDADYTTRAMTSLRWQDRNTAIAVKKVPSDC